MNDRIRNVERSLWAHRSAVETYRRCEAFACYARAGLPASAMRGSGNGTARSSPCAGWRSRPSAVRSSARCCASC